MSRLRTDALENEREQKRERGQEGSIGFYKWKTLGDISERN